MTRDARILVGAQALFNVGFYAIVPYFVVVLRDDHALSSAAIGIILGARTLSQQGLFALGGLLADRWGSKPLIVVGCLARAAGFALLLVAAGFTLLLTGFRDARSSWPR